ncbi:MAG: hypothetical protein Q4E05_05795, partial [Pseudoclavibacter sp.]|nr:hypothetical protein [Pseudoclavibacter sp.]
MATTKRARCSRGTSGTPEALGTTSPAETLAEAAQRLAGLLGPELTALLDAPAAGPERDAPLWRAEAVASVFARNRDRLALLHALAQRASAAYTSLLAGVFEQAEAHVPDQDLE